MKKAKLKNRKSVILRLCMVLVVTYAAIYLIDMQVTLSARAEQLDELTQAVEAQRLANKELERQLEAGVDEEYIENVARDKLDYVYPNERVFIDISGS